MFYLYIALTFIITCLGTVSGISGGTILKPFMDLAGGYNAAQIGVLAGCAVFTMSFISFIRNIGAKRLQPAGALGLGFGAVAGGFAGQLLLKTLIANTGGTRVQLCQNIILGLLLLGVLAHTFLIKNPKTLSLRHNAAFFTAGIFMGLAAAFLSIGGGPINMPILMLLFGMDIKNAAIHSLLIILFAQGAKLLTVLATDGLAAFNLLPLLPLMAAAAVAGSLLGAALNKKLNPRGVKILFAVMLAAVLGVVGFNIANFARAL